MNGRGTIAGIPISMWTVGLVAGVLGFLWIRKRMTSGSAPGQPSGAPSFTQQQEVQDFQIFSALTSQQQSSDLNFLGEVASLFAGGSSPTSAPSSSPANTGGVPPAVESAYQQGVAGQLQFQSQPQATQLQQLAASPDQSQLQSLAGALSSVPPGQQGSLENFFLLNQANQQAGYDYYTGAGLQTTPLGVAPGE